MRRPPARSRCWWAPTRPIWTRRDPIFASLATRVLHFGAVGQGTVYKLMVNLMGAVQIASAAEGMVLAERAGLDLKLVADAVGQRTGRQSAGGAQRAALRRRAITAATVNFTPALRLKDIEYALRLAKQARASTARSAKSPRSSTAGSASTASRSDNESRIIDVLRSKQSARACRPARCRCRAACSVSDIAGLVGQRAQQHAPGSAAIGAGRDVRTRPGALPPPRAAAAAARARAR